MSSVANDGVRIEKQILLLRLLMLVPVLNWFIRDAIYGPWDAKFYFAGNILLAWFLAIVFFGYPAVIIPALTAVPLAFLWILETCR